jgi:hypothetical protein
MIETPSMFVSAPQTDDDEIVAHVPLKSIDGEVAMWT